MLSRLSSLGGGGEAYGGGSGGGRWRGGRLVKLGWEQRKAATWVGFCQRSIGVRFVGLFGHEKRCWTVSGVGLTGQDGQLGVREALMEWR